VLTAAEFSVGSIGEALGLTLVLPRNKHEHTVLIAHAPGYPAAVVLDGSSLFASFDCTGNTNWKGILIPNVAIEVDEQSVFDPDYDRTPLGTVIRAGTELSITVRPDNTFPRQIVRLPVQAELPPCGEGMAAAFRRWRVVIGEELDKRELKAIEVKPPHGPG
jgi:hypothetical protein